MFMISVGLCFDVAWDFGNALFGLDLFFFIFDIFVKMHSAYYKNGKLNLKRKKILKHYMKKDFIFDLLGVIGSLFLKIIFMIDRFACFSFSATEPLSTFVVIFVLFADEKFFFKIKSSSALLSF